MALPTVASVVADVENLYAAFADDKTKWGMESAVRTLNELSGTLNRLYRPVHTLTVTDTTDATLVAFFAASGQGSAIRLKEVFRVTGAGDTTDNGLQTAKGGVVVANDVFIRDGASAVAFLGNYASDFPFDFAGETPADFVNL